MRMVVVALILLALILLVVGWARVCLRRRGSVQLSSVLRRWRPRTPDACAHCRLALLCVSPAAHWAGLQ